MVKPQPLQSQKLQSQKQLQSHQLQHQETLAEMEMVTVADAKSFSQVQVKLQRPD